MKMGISVILIVQIAPQPAILRSVRIFPTQFLPHLLTGCFLQAAAAGLVQFVQPRLDNAPEFRLLTRSCNHNKLNSLLDPPG